MEMGQKMKGRVIGLYRVFKQTMLLKLAENETMYTG